ncbi:hypothetical protein GLOIN_2v1786818 [Rhizophagus clarus]|uniref:Uncharacterized protein n=1 Tax=Rhizophagus clarus TaxID=94130 RepID=A0A8H3L855_9GLOM|nr:hypothetical protein GLOIN_2v1786818 [Rhizophagus clarus]
MPYFIVHVEEERKILISSRVVKESSLSSNGIHVFVGKGDSKWNFVQGGLQEELNLLTALGFTHVKFVIQPENNLQKLQNTNKVNAFKVGWTGGLHETVGKKFVERLVALIWYTDPHLQKFNTRKLYLPEFFLELDQFKINLNYNRFYSEGKHKKHQLDRNILVDLTSSLNLSLSAP